MVKKLLLVGEAQDGAADLLRSAGFEVTRASTDVEAARMIDGYVPDVIVLDGVEGPGVLADREDTRAIPIVLVTERMTRGPEGPGGPPSPIRRFIYKPCRPRTFVEGVEHVLRFGR